MMVGLGIDIQSIDEFAAATHVRASDLCFTPAEHAHSEQSAAGALVSLAGMYAAKEALLKALPERPLVYWDELEVGHDGRGRPCFVLGGALAQWMQARRWRAMPSISHSAAYAVAVAVVEEIQP